MTPEQTAAAQTLSHQKWTDELHALVALYDARKCTALVEWDEDCVVVTISLTWSQRAITLVRTPGKRTASYTGEWTDDLHPHLEDELGDWASDMVRAYGAYAPRFTVTTDQ